MKQQVLCKSKIITYSLTRHKSYEKLHLSAHIANISNEKVNENLKAEGKSIYGHVAGTKKHTEAANIVKEYQDNMKSRNNLAVEKNWKDNVRINGNEKGSTRLDVYDKDTNTVYDYKFVGLSHNTVRGAAGGAVLCAETLKAKGYITKK